MSKSKERRTIRLGDFRPFYTRGDKIYAPFYADGEWREAVLSLERARLAVMYALPLVGSIGANIYPLIRLARKSVGG